MLERIYTEKSAEITIPDKVRLQKSGREISFGVPFRTLSGGAAIIIITRIAPPKNWQPKDEIMSIKINFA